MKKVYTILVYLTVLLLVLMLSGCTENTDSVPPNTAVPERDVSMTLLVESSSTDQLSRYIDNAVEQFQRDYENVTIYVEEIPEDAESRDAMLTLLRTEIANGGGPDIYLLPTSVVANGGTHLFQNVNLAMRDGMFADISYYYDIDTALGKNELNTAVMDAGVVDGKRFTLPLRYDMSVVYANAEQLVAQDLTTEDFSGGTLAAMDAALENNDADAARDILSSVSKFSALRIFADLVDYDKERVLLQKDTLVSFLETYQKLRELQGQDIKYGDSSAIQYCISEHWLDRNLGFNIDGLSSASDNAAVAKASGKEIQMFPFKSVEGKTVADITLFGAVSRDCEYPMLAYEFLRIFLTDDVQWEQDIARTIVNQNKITWGYPVRTESSVKSLLENQGFDLSGAMTICDPKNKEQMLIRIAAINEIELTNDDVPILEVQIDQVRYRSFYLENCFASMLMELNDSLTGVANDVDIEEMAEDFLEKLDCHLLAK